ncbi:MAG: hypothetical protein C4321_10340 [Chloroflexota bacterium]
MPAMTLVDQLTITAADRPTRLRWLGLTDRDVGDVAEIAEPLTAVAEEMRAPCERAVEAIASTPAVSELSATAAEQVSAGVEEVSAQAGELANLPRRLGDVTTNMSSLLARFGSLAHDSEGRAYRPAA